MLTVKLVCTVPANVKICSPLGKHPLMLSRPRENRFSRKADIIVYAPENHTDIEPALFSTIKNIKQASAPVGHLKIRINKGDRPPNTILGCLYCFTDTSEGVNTVNKRLTTLPPLVG